MELQTQRLRIRPLQAGDWRDMQRIWADFSASAYAVFDRPLPVEDGEVKALTEAFASTGLFYGVFLPENGIIGYVCFHREAEVYDLGYCFHSAWHGQGYGEESCRAVLAWLLGDRPGVDITAGTALENIPSCCLLNKLGFLLEGTEWLSFYEGQRFRGGSFRLDRKAFWEDTTDGKRIDP